MSTPITHVTDEHVKRFHEQGYLVIEDAFDEEEIERMRTEADHILELIVNSSLANERKSGRLDLVEGDEGEQQIRKIQPINDLSLFLSEVSEDDRLLDPMRAIMDDEPILMEEKLNYKEPLPEPVPLESDRASSEFPVHNDWAYYKAQDYPRAILSSAIAIDDCTPENGPMRVWPGSHEEHLEHEQVEGLGLEVPADDIDHDAGEQVLAPAGSVMFFHSLLAHSSSGNESGAPRRLMIYSHYPEAAEMGFDIRNGPGRLRESPWEWEYQRKKDRGEYEDEFEAPAF